MIGNILNSYWRDFSNDFYAKSPKQKLKTDLPIAGMIVRISTTIVSPLFITGIMMIPSHYFIEFINPGFFNSETVKHDFINYFCNIWLLLEIIFGILFIAPYALKYWFLECFRQFTDKYRVDSIDEINDKDLGYGLVFKNLTLIKNIHLTFHTEIQLFETHIKLLWKYPIVNKPIWQKAYTWDNFSSTYSYINIAPWVAKPHQMINLTGVTNKKSHFLWLFYPLGFIDKFTQISVWKMRKSKKRNPDNFSDEKINYEVNRLKNSDFIRFNLVLFQHEPNTIVTILYYLEENHPTKAILKEIHDEFYKITPPMEERIQIHNQSHEMQLIPFQHEAFKSGRITAGDMEKFGMQLNKMDRFFDKFKRKK